MTYSSEVSVNPPTLTTRTLVLDLLHIPHTLIVSHQVNIVAFANTIVAYRSLIVSTQCHPATQRCKEREGKGILTPESLLTPISIRSIGDSHLIDVVAFRHGN